MVPKDATTFALGLQRGADPEHADVHLHLRAQLGVPSLVVRNSRLDGAWGLEESQPCAFPAAPKALLLVITTFLDSYEVEVNGSSVLSFKVRDGLPISSVTHLAIEAGLLVRAIHEPVESMPRNLRLNMGEGAKVGDMVFIQGKPTEGAKSFVINWQSGPGKFDDVLFQLHPRLEEGGVVCNSRLDDEWGQQETADDVPLRPGVPFGLVVAVTPLGFECILDGRPWVRFPHRHAHQEARTLFIEGDLEARDIRIDSAQSNLPTLDGLKARGSRLQLVCPELPVLSRVMGGFENGCLLLVSGKMHSQPKSLQLTVQFGEDTSDSDIALCYDINYSSDGLSKITLNSREDDKWSQLITAKDFEGPFSGRYFDLTVTREDEGFVCYMDGVEQISFPYQLEDHVPNHVTLSGDFDCYRLLLL